MTVALLSFVTGTREQRCTRGSEGYTHTCAPSEPSSPAHCPSPGPAWAKSYVPKRGALEHRLGGRGQGPARGPGTLCCDGPEPGRGVWSHRAPRGPGTLPLCPVWGRRGVPEAQEAARRGGGTAAHCTGAHAPSSGPKQHGSGPCRCAWRGNRAQGHCCQATAVCVTRGQARVAKHNAILARHPGHSKDSTGDTPVGSARRAPPGSAAARPWGRTQQPQVAEKRVSRPHRRLKSQAEDGPHGDSKEHGAAAPG